ncbi:MAG TPA: S8 family serine peptidase [Myxococcales bacterium]|jgi:hypothetical protein
MLCSRAFFPLAVSLLLAAAPARGAKVDPALRTGLAAGTRQIVILGLASPERDRALPGSTSDQLFSLPDPFPLASLAPHAAAQVRVMAALRGHPAGAPRLVRAYARLPMLALEATPEQLKALEALEGVEHLWSSPVGRPLLSSTLPFSKATDFQQRGFKGAGTTVAVADLAVRYWTGEFGTCPTDSWADATPGCALVAWKNFNLWPAAPDDEAENDPRTIAEAKNHGTHVAAIVHGVAPEAKLIGLNVFSLSPDGSYGSPAYDVLAALDWVAEHAAEQHIVAVNLSVGWEHSDAAPCNESVAFPAIRELWKQGVALVTASGNDATADWVNEPACASLAVSVGAQYDTDLASVASCEPGAPKPGDLACLSNLNGAVDLVAPGMHVDAAGATKSGTSMAAPHVAGAIALQQSRWMAELGARKSPAWAREQLIMDAVSRPHDGRVFHQLSLADGPRWTVGALFPAFDREASEATIPKAPATFERRISFAGRGGKVAGAYLHLKLAHETPGTVQATVIAPGGKQVALTLPAVGPHFNAVLGKDYLPGAFASLAGSPIDGQWRLLLSDASGSGLGHYLAAALFLVAEGCTPSCPASEGCGDDGCGGSCGTCAGIERCGAERTCVECTPSCGGRACGPDGCGGSCGACADTAWCNGLETCKTGQCEWGAPRCWQSLDCGTLTCDEASKSCLPAVTDSKACLLGLACYGDAEVNPANPCQKCDASHPAEWSATSGACDDGDACTTADACQIGRCAGTPKDCSSLAGPCKSATCDSPTGECVAADLADGTSCDDGDTCTTGDVCRAGACEPGPRTCSGCGCTASSAPQSRGIAWILALLAGSRRRRNRAPRRVQ